MPETTNPIEAIFLEALDKPQDQWQAFLQQRCGDDAELLQKVTELLASHEKTGSFIVDKRPAWQALTETPDFTAKVGQKIGPYTLRERIGEGGMGVVYVAEQERPIRRKVALKVIKPGMDSKAVLARFEAEQQALAIMNHRNIAKVLDAGIAESGRPYFVMELVSGIPITEYCDEKQLTIEERLGLFIEVCKAIQHAHQKGIIHRDIKPSNVLVTEEDGQAIPKVIDFGVAKALSQKLTERTLYTNFQAFLGTPMYASPEQASLSNVDVDTRSDVYSLGVLLYELVTGSTPHDKQQLHHAAYEEMCRIIREQQPVRPSTRLSTMGDTATEVSTRRRSEPSRLIQSVRGDLDWIVMKALEKDRARRYEGANNLAADISRLLKNEAIEARPPSVLYRLNRTYSRHKVAVVSSVVFMAFLASVLGFVISTLQAKYQTLAKYRVQTIEVTFERAINESDLAFDKSLRIAEETGVSEDWLDTLRGIRAFHSGNNEQAIELFDAALDNDEANTAAWGMKAVALIDQGDFHEWNLHIADSEKYQPRLEYEEIDKLCLAYATYHTNLNDAVSKLEEVLHDHPTWNMARVIFAGALAEQGEQNGEPDLVRQALKEIAVAHHITPQNRFTQLVFVMTHNVAVRAQIQDPQFLLSETKRVADSLAQESDYDIGKLIFADYCSLVSEYDPSDTAKERELSAWTQLTNLQGNFASRAYAELFRLHRTQDVIQATPSDPEATIARAMVLAQQEATIEEAYQILAENKEKHASWSIRLQIVELQLLLKQRQEAIELCEKWVVDSSPVKQLDEYSQFHRQVIEHFVSGDMSNLETKNAWQQFRKEYFLVLLAYSKEEMSQARIHLEYCVNHRSMNVADHWARAFLARWDF